MWVTPDDASVASLARYRDVATIVSPVLFRVTFEAGGPRVLAWSTTARTLSKRVTDLGFAESTTVPLVACLGACARELSTQLASTDARAALVTALAAVAAPHAGIVVDFEDLKCEASAFSSFIASLADALHAHGPQKRVIVAVHPPCPAGTPRTLRSSCVQEGGSYDFAALARAVDHLAVMFYDHDTSGERAPQPRAWITGGITRLDTLVASEHRGRVLIGAPLYGRMSSSLTGRSDVLYGAALRGRVHGHAAELSPLTLDREALSSVGTIRVERDGVTRSGRIFLETNASLRERLALALPYGGVALWRLGEEDPCTPVVLGAFRRGDALDVVPCLP